MGYSKKLENLKYGAALFIWHFNFCRIHSAHGIASLFLAENSSERLASVIPLLGIGTLAVVLIFVFRAIIRPKYGLCIFTAAQEQEVLSSLNLKDVRAIESALRQAISLRG